MTPFLVAHSLFTFLVLYISQPPSGEPTSFPLSLDIGKADCPFYPHTLGGGAVAQALANQQVAFPLTSVIGADTVM